VAFHVTGKVGHGMILAMKKIPLIFVAISVLSLSFISLAVLWPHASNIHAIQSISSNNRLNYYVQEAKAKGQNRIVVPSPIIEYVTNVQNLHSALKQYTLVVVTPINKVTVTTDWGEIRTWYKFKISESVSPKKYNPCTNCTPPAFLPNELLPVNPDEILVSVTGGIVVVDGIRLMMRPEFIFNSSESYLLFLQEDKSGLFGRIMVGPDTIFKVAADGSLIDGTNNPHDLKKIIKEQYKGNLKELRTAAKQQE
jgi:hypothetical protein